MPSCFGSWIQQDTNKRCLYIGTEGVKDASLNQNQILLVVAKGKPQSTEHEIYTDRLGTII